MLIRFVVDNVYSFGEEREFNMLPQPRLRTLEHHKYHVGGLDLVKLGAIYGSNGAGKSNLVKALAMLQGMVTGKAIPYKLEKSRFKFAESGIINRQLLGVQFIENGIPFYYGLEVKDMIVSCEELYILGLEKSEDQLIFERKVDGDGNPTLKFRDEFETDPESQILKRVILKNLIKGNETILRTLAELGNPFLEHVGTAVEWFRSSLVIVTPEMKPKWLPQLFDEDTQLGEFAEEVMRSLNLGICKMVVEKESVKEDPNNSQAFEETMEAIGRAPGQMVSRYSKEAGMVVTKREGDNLITKKIVLGHDVFGGKQQFFDLGEESDGTNRLLDLIPLIKGISRDRKVFVIDEIERSIHPILMKELLSKFSQDAFSQGQLIFTTHESNLLDQDILRRDEVWFAEKDERGCTDLYSLSDFKEHNTLDIRKGYLQGRYGAVPFLGNLHDLNWHSHAPQL